MTKKEAKKVKIGDILTLIETGNVYKVEYILNREDNWGIVGKSFQCIRYTDFFTSATNVGIEGWRLPTKCEKDIANEMFKQ